jgi:hypothetical protein
MIPHFVDDDGIKRRVDSVAGQKALNAAIDEITGWKDRRCDYAAIPSDMLDALDTLPDCCLPRIMRHLNPYKPGYVYVCTILFFNASQVVVHTVSIEGPTWALAGALAFLEASRILKETKVIR